jgi:hypothetical protein
VADLAFLPRTLFALRMTGISEGTHATTETRRNVAETRRNPAELFFRVQIPIQSGRVFRREAGHRSGLKPATIPR